MCWPAKGLRGAAPGTRVLGVGEGCAGLVKAIKIRCPHFSIAQPVDRIEALIVGEEKDDVGPVLSLCPDQKP